MKRRLFILLCLLITLLMAGTASAEMLSGAFAKYEYDQGILCFEEGLYTDAAGHFALARNYEDAQKWLYYCQAISDVINGDGSLACLENAQLRFSLLSCHGFEEADQWMKYCDGRIYELNKMKHNAIEAYSTILVHDSINNYLRLNGRDSLLEPYETVQQRVQDFDFLPSCETCYQAGDDQFVMAETSQDYRRAADYFCLAQNFRDARQRRCYCLAIAMIIDADSTQQSAAVKEHLENASLIFTLLKAQGYEEADQWVTYCRGRDYEQRKMYRDAIAEYQKIFLYDSSTRYIVLSEKYTSK